ncbi:MAG: cupin domain-containing protein [Candidatus Omnitrophica bacterium]|nr:cupin domain-containing protein [Candidatus Omnitrophota bacterium]
MIKKKSEQVTEVRKNMRGGPGEVLIRHHFKREEINAPSRLCAELTLAPGSGIGEHDHVNEDEVYIIQQGKGVIVDNGKEVEIEAGDAILTGKGSSHSIKNVGDTDLIVTAVIMQYSS